MPRSVQLWRRKRHRPRGTSLLSFSLAQLQSTSSAIPAVSKGLGMPAASLAPFGAAAMIGHLTGPTVTQVAAVFAKRRYLE